MKSEDIEKRWKEVDRHLADIADGKVVDGDPAELEGVLLDELDNLEYEAGINYLRNRKKHKLTAPTLPAYSKAINHSVYWLVWCKHCEVWHRHGPAEGHREAHCKDELSPYWKSGYNLAFAGEWDDKERNERGFRHS